MKDSAMSNAKTLAYIPALDGVRALSIILVILTHTAPLGPKSWRFNEMAGPMGMSLFFCLSGFLIVSLLARNADAVSFFIRRTLRIVPSVALYVTLMVVLFGLTFQGVVENLLFITNYGFEGRGRGSVPAPLTHIWSLSVEMQFYVAIGLAALLMGRKCLYLVPIAAVIITGIRISTGNTIDIATHLRVDEILAGGTLALASLHWGETFREKLKNPRLALILLTFATLIWMVSCHPLGGPVMYARPYLTAVAVGIVIYSHIAWLHRILEGRIAAYIARISYALYIYHPMMIWGWMNTGSDLERYLLKRPLSYALTLVAAHASTFWWEAYWQKLAKRLTSTRKEPSPL